MVVSATGAAATTTNSDTIVAKDKSGELRVVYPPEHPGRCPSVPYVSATIVS